MGGDELMGSSDTVLHDGSYIGQWMVARCRILSTSQRSS